MLTVLLGGKNMRLRVVSVQDHAAKADASSMYEVLGEE